MKEFGRINIGRVLDTIARARAFIPDASPCKRRGVTIFAELAGTLSRDLFTSYVSKLCAAHSDGPHECAAHNLLT